MLMPRPEFVAIPKELNFNLPAAGWQVRGFTASRNDGCIRHCTLKPFIVVSMFFSIIPIITPISPQCAAAGPDSLEASCKMLWFGQRFFVPFFGGPPFSHHTAPNRARHGADVAQPPAKLVL